MTKKQLIKQSEKGAISFEGNTLTNLGAPIQPNDAARKTEVDSKLSISDFEIEKGGLEAKDNNLQDQIDNIVSDLGEVQVETNTNTTTNTIQQDQIDKNKIDINLNEIKIGNNEQKDKQQDIRLSALEDVVESFFEDDAIIVNEGPVNLTSTPTNFIGTIEKQFDEIDVNEVINKLDATVIEVKPGNLVKGEIGMGLTFTKVPLKESFTFVMEVFNYLTGETETYINEDGIEKPIRYTTNFEWPSGVSIFTTEYKFFKNEFDEGTRAIRYYTGNAGEEVILKDITVGVINKATETITGDITNSGDLTDISTVGGTTVEESLNILNSGKVNGISGTTGKLTELNPLEFVERDGIISVGNGYNVTLDTTSKTFVGAINEKLNITRDFTSSSSGISGTIDNTNAQASSSSYTETYLGQMKSITGASGTTEANIGLRVGTDGKVNAVARYKDSSGNLVPVDTTLPFGLTTKEYVDEADTGKVNGISYSGGINTTLSTGAGGFQVSSVSNDIIVASTNFDTRSFSGMETTAKTMIGAINELNNKIDALVPIGTIQLGATAPTFGTWTNLGTLSSGQTLVGGDNTNGLIPETDVVFSGDDSQFNGLFSGGAENAETGDQYYKYVHIGVNPNGTREPIAGKIGSGDKNIPYGIGLGLDVKVWKRTA